MLIEFSFGNFRSFKDIQSLNMTAAKISSKNKKLDEDNISQEGKYKVLKTKAIYGANASGKSNIVKAFMAFQFIIRDSVGNKDALKLIEPFALSTETENAPSFFQLIFSIGGIVYRYGFEATRERIHSEWLFGTPGQREVPFFVREENSIVDINKKHFKEGVKILSLFDNEDGDNEPFRKNSLFLSTTNSLNGKLSKDIVLDIIKVICIDSVKENNMHAFSRDCLDGFSENEKLNRTFASLNLKDRINDFFKNIDIGFEKTEVLDTSRQLGGKKERVVISKHKKYNTKNEQIGFASFDFIKNESEGTQKLFNLSTAIIVSMEIGSALIIDEIDAKLHPILTRSIIELYDSKENAKGAQLIFVTHDTNLLSADLLRRDQIEFTEKDKYGASHLYPLVQFKGLRNTASFEKDYIRGKYGAIPFIGNLKESLFNTDADAEEAHLH